MSCTVIPCKQDWVRIPLAEELVSMQWFGALTIALAPHVAEGVSRLDDPIMSGVRYGCLQTAYWDGRRLNLVCINIRSRANHNWS